MRTIPFQLDEYLEEAAILFNRRNWFVEQPHVGLMHLLELDRRIDAQLDGLVEAGEPAWEICHASLLTRQPGECFATSFLALHSGQSARMDQVLAAALGKDDLVRPVAMALGWRPWKEVEQLARKWMQSGGWLTAVGLAAHLIHSIDPGECLSDLIDSSDAVVRRIALRGAGELGRAELSNRAAAHVTDADAESALWAAWSLGMLRGDEQDIQRLASIATRHSDRAAWFLPAVIERTDRATTRNWLQQLVSSGCDRLAIALVARQGFRECIPWLLEKMSDPSAARIAAEALTTITGLRIQGGSWEVPCPEGFESGPTDEPDDENVSMDSDEYLSWPNVAAVSEWWSVNEKSFEDDQSYLLGRPRTKEWLWSVVHGGLQRERFQAALSLAVQWSGRKLFDVRAPSELQLRRLTATQRGFAGKIADTMSDRALALGSSHRTGG